MAFPTLNLMQRSLIVVPWRISEKQMKFLLKGAHLTGKILEYSFVIKFINLVPLTGNEAVHFSEGRWGFLSVGRAHLQHDRLKGLVRD